MSNICPNCNRPQLILPNVIELTECPYCHYQFEIGSEGVDFPEEDTSHLPDVPNLNTDIAEMLLRTQNILCNYCGHNNPFSNVYCEKCGSNLSWASVFEEGDNELKLSRQLTQEQRENCLVEGLIAFMKALMKREGNQNGLLWCNHCNYKYKFTEFFCPNCGELTWLSEMREVLEGTIHNKGLIQEFQRSFPNYKIIDYANSASFQSGLTNSMKIELENITRNTKRILEAGAIYLKANTQEVKKSKGSSDESSSEGNLFDLLMGNVEDNTPDDRVMDFLGSTSIHIEDENEDINEMENPVENPPVDEADWFDD